MNMIIKRRSVGIFKILQKHCAVFGEVLIYLAFFLIPLFLLTPTRIQGDSMNPTLSSGQLAVVARTKYNPLIEIKRGDIVLVMNQSRGYLIAKRVIALPGDTLEISNNQVIVNGEVLEEDYLPEPMITEDIPSFTLEDSYFVMGDNRNVSRDSRSEGSFSEDDISGVVVLSKTLPTLLAMAVWITLIILSVRVYYSYIDRKTAASQQEESQPSED